MSALNWSEWAQAHPLEVTVIPAQADCAIVKPEVVSRGAPVGEGT